MKKWGFFNEGKKKKLTKSYTFKYSPEESHNKTIKSYYQLSKITLTEEVTMNCEGENNVRGRRMKPDKQIKTKTLLANKVNTSLRCERGDHFHYP